MNKDYSDETNPYGVEDEECSIETMFPSNNYKYYLQNYIKEACLNKQSCLIDFERKSKLSHELSCACRRKITEKRATEFLQIVY